VTRSGRPQVVIDGHATAWGDLRDQADAFASTISGAHAIAVVAVPSVSSVVALLGGLTARVPVVPVSPDAGPLERDHVLADCGADLLFEGGRLLDLQPARPAPTTDAALVLYTSGTTGPPKGVPVSAAAIRACIAALADAWAWTPDDLLVHGLPLHHVHGLVLGLLGPLHVGSGLHHTGRPTPADYAAAGGSLYFGVPTVWTRVSRDPSSARALAGARLLVSGSASLPAPVFDALETLAGQAPVERYGMTETLIMISARADSPRVRGSVGVPLPGVATRLVDDAGSPVDAGIGAIGELEVQGTTVFEGYLGRPDATSGAFTADGWFRTGDVASIDADGLHRIVGRAATDLIKSGGYRIGAGEIEDALQAHPGVDEAAVVGVPDADLGQRIVAYVVAPGLDQETLIEHVATQLSRHKRPRDVVLVDRLPRNAMGKVDKSRLGTTAGPSMTAPATD
jgi:fatty acid CoA ligase FadD36